MNKKGQLSSIFNTPFSIIGIVGLLIIFMIIISMIPDPEASIQEVEISTYGDIFVMNYLKYDKVNFNGNMVSIYDLLLLYIDSDYTDTIVEDLLESETINIMDGLFEQTDSCFTLRLKEGNSVSTLIRSNFGCNENKIETEFRIPYGKYDSKSLIISGK
ncbi:hypothetical protein C0585_00355 [Candidatus Woesearchaeota archaeon]|nr:MAG: hypothetical protein C0585_00355 [Candidatus Woesearchaeota archaeon]